MSNELDQSRRDLLKQIGAAVSLAGMGQALLPAQEVQHVHQALAQDKAVQKGKYQPKALTAHEYATLQRLSDLIIPADEHSKGALEAGAAERGRGAWRSGSAKPATKSQATGSAGGAGTGRTMRSSARSALPAATHRASTKTLSSSQPAKTMRAISTML